ncbi:hypothetical protein GCG54_00015324 [Colletotrichum gloeosporioides]|uniref:Uncharacterized protein n=1 Tax=Colletotrichum gloeosporioides TaxID=474922 RepID=A0A8H4C7Z4_COLGL|nr:uncharacterized protein GCG54_00015324 [Colletotrichum gloeosporioides]KAF3799140.1 hypothetical protein GCG54_00015324 [Colletotrichum gloeosporioides]
MSRELELHLPVQTAWQRRKALLWNLRQIMEACKTPEESQSRRFLVQLDQYHLEREGALR